MSAELGKVIREAAKQLEDGGLVEKAQGRIRENRNRYSPPTDTFPLIAQRWSQVLGCPVDAVDVATCMAELKAVRLVFNPNDEDSRVDQYGYLLIRDDLLRAQGDCYEI